MSESNKSRMKVLKYSIQSTTSLATKIVLEQELEILESQNKT